MLIDAFGTRQEGVWLDGRLEGQGRLSGSRGFSYIGNFKNGRYDGEGVLTDIYGTVFTGSWVNGSLQGEGSETREDGTHYAGGWRNESTTGRAPCITPVAANTTGNFCKGHGTGEDRSSTLFRIASRANGKTTS